LLSSSAPDSDHGRYTEAKAKQEEDLARSLERDRKKQERKARQEGRKQETEGWSNGLLDEVVARECRELVREVMFELAQVPTATTSYPYAPSALCLTVFPSRDRHQEKRDVNVWQIRASMQPPAAVTPAPAAKTFPEPAIFVQPPPQRYVPSGIPFMCAWVELLNL
jgi:hypothetical protein